MNKRIKLKKGILHKKCNEDCSNYRTIIHFRFITNNLCAGCKFIDDAYNNLCKSNNLDRPQVFQVDDYYKVVANNEEEAKELYLSELDGEEDNFLGNIVEPSRHKMWFPIEMLPKQYYKKPFKDFEGLCTEIPLSVAMHYRKDKVPYVLSVSSSLY